MQVTVSDRRLVDDPASSLAGIKRCSPDNGGYPVIMSTAEHPPEALDLVVGADGSGIVDAAQLARLGVTPGTHLAVVPTGAVGPTRKRRSVRGALAHLGPTPSWEDFETASEAAVSDHEARYGPDGRWGPPAL